MGKRTFKIASGTKGTQTRLELDEFYRKQHLEHKFAESPKSGAQD